MELINAAENGDLDKVKELIDGGANVDTQDKSGYTALMYAVWGGHLPVVKVLLAAGVNVNLQTKSGDTALMLAAYRGRTEIVKELLEGGADVTLQNHLRKTVLNIPFQDKHIDYFNMLLEAATRQYSTCEEFVSFVNQRDCNGDTALMWVGRTESIQIMNALLEAGAQIDAYTVWCVRLSSPTFAKILEEKLSRRLRKIKPAK